MAVKRFCSFCGEEMKVEFRHEFYHQETGKSMGRYWAFECPVIAGTKYWYTKHDVGGWISVPIEAPSK